MNIDLILTVGYKFQNKAYIGVELADEYDLDNDADEIEEAIWAEEQSQLWEQLGQVMFFEFDRDASEIVVFLNDEETDRIKVKFDAEATDEEVIEDYWTDADFMYDLINLEIQS